MNNWMDSRNKQIPPPKTWQSFEDLCLSLFKAMWRDPYAQKNGRVGQPQHGVDVVSSTHQQNMGHFGVQCKGKDVALGAAVSRQELLDEIAKAESFVPPLRHWILATTAPADGELQKVAREVSVARERQGKFTVTVLGWSEIENLLCDHPEVLESHYPELGLDVGLLLRRMQKIVDGEETDAPTVRTSTPTAWRRVDFHSSRDIGPALLGRPLGPSDALACPRLPEANRAMQQLETAFSARIVGVPGAGKSVCAYQVAYSFATRGWKVFSVKASESALETLPVVENDDVLLLVDDAHLIAECALRSVEDHAGRRRLVLSTCTAGDDDSCAPGSIRMDPAAGIHAIASGLLSNRQATLDAVRRADSHVGDLMMDTALEERIAHAAGYAQVPWQFCFVLGGGWRRANDALATARILKLDMLLGAIAIRQLASRDAIPTQQHLAELVVAAGLSVQTIKVGIRRLVQERLVISESDVRCPHQRLASVLLEGLVQRQDGAGRAAIGEMLKAVLADDALPLAGASTLMAELRFAERGRSTGLIEVPALGTVLARCWSADGPEERMRACLVLNEAVALAGSSEAHVLENHEEELVTWIENAVDPMGHGLRWLLNTLFYKNAAFANAITRSADPRAIAELISSANVSSVWHIAELAQSLRLTRDDEWTVAVVDNLDRERLLVLAASWPDEQPLHQIVRLFDALVWPAETLALDMVEVFLPVARRALAAEPISQFHQLNDLARDVLRVLDPLAIYKGKLAPTPRQLRLARGLFDGIDLQDLADKLSLASLRDFQTVAFLLAFAAKCAPAKAEKIVLLINWKSIGLSIGEHWKRLPHEAEVLLGVASRTAKSRKPVADLIRDNLDWIELMPARLAVIAPNLAVEFVRQGRRIALASFDHVEWRYAAFVLALFQQKDAALLPVVLSQCIPAMARSLSQPHASWYEESEQMLQGMVEHAPASLELVLDQIEVDRARVGWAAAWDAGGDTRKCVKLLLKAAAARSDPIGDFARRFRPARKAA